MGAFLVRLASWTMSSESSESRGSRPEFLQKEALCEFDDDSHRIQSASVIVFCCLHAAVPVGKAGVAMTKEA